MCYMDYPVYLPNYSPPLYFNSLKRTPHEVVSILIDNNITLSEILKDMLERGLITEKKYKEILNVL